MRLEVNQIKFFLLKKSNISQSPNDFVKFFNCFSKMFLWKALWEYQFSSKIIFSVPRSLLWKLYNPRVFVFVILALSFRSHFWLTVDEKYRGAAAPLVQYSWLKCLDCSNIGRIKPYFLYGGKYSAEFLIRLLETTRRIARLLCSHRSFLKFLIYNLFNRNVCYVFVLTNSAFYKQLWIFLIELNTGHSLLTCLCLCTINSVRSCTIFQLLFHAHPKLKVSLKRQNWNKTAG